MSKFLCGLYLRMFSAEELKGGKQLYALTQDLIYDSEMLGTICVPEGFVTDFASIPRIAWRYIDPEDPCIAYPSVVHDWLYNVGSPKCTREQADKVFREAMGVCGARLDQRAVVYSMVRMFGGSHWKGEKP